MHKQQLAGTPGLSNFDSEGSSDPAGLPERTGRQILDAAH